MRNKALVKYLCEIGGIDFYTVPDHTGISLWERSKSCWVRLGEEYLTVNLAQLDFTWQFEMNDEGKVIAPTPSVVKRGGGKVLVDLANPPWDPNDTTYGHAVFGFPLTDEQFVKAKALEAANELR